VHEAFVIRDGNRAEYDGLSVHRAVSAVTDEIAPVLVGAELDDPRSLDRVLIELDGSCHQPGSECRCKKDVSTRNTFSWSSPPA
jgi:enolase